MVSLSPHPERRPCPVSTRAPVKGASFPRCGKSCRPHVRHKLPCFYTEKTAQHSRIRFRTGPIFSAHPSFFPCLWTPADRRGLSLTAKKPRRRPRSKAAGARRELRREAGTCHLTQGAQGKAEGRDFLPADTEGKSVNLDSTPARRPSSHRPPPFFPHAPAVQAGGRVSFDFPAPNPAFYEGRR